MKRSVVLALASLLVIGSSLAGCGSLQAHPRYFRGGFGYGSAYGSAYGRPPIIVAPPAAVIPPRVFFAPRPYIVQPRPLWGGRAWGRQRRGC